MCVIDPDMLQAFRQPRCEHCQKCVVGFTDAAHVWAKGMGGGKTLDIRVNLVSLCRICHTDTHDRPSHATLLLLAAQREGVMQRHIEEVVWFFGRLPKRPTAADVQTELAEVLPGARRLVRRTLAEVPEEQQTWRE